MRQRLKHFTVCLHIQDKGNVLFLSVGSIQRNLHRLLCEAQLVLTEDVDLHLVMENCEKGGNKQFTEGEEFHSN